MRESGSYTAYSMGELGWAGTQGGLQTINGALPGGNRSASIICTCAVNPSFSIFSVAQAKARGGKEPCTLEFYAKVHTEMAYLKDATGQKMNHHLVLAHGGHARDS